MLGKTVFTWWGSLICPHADALLPEYITGLSEIEKSMLYINQPSSVCISLSLSLIDMNHVLNTSTRLHRPDQASFPPGTSYPLSFSP